MKLKQLFRNFTIFEWVLWAVSVITVALSFVLSPSKDWWSLFASVIGVTAILFCAKGHVLGQMLVVVFAVLYGVISYFQRYYGEMITYLCMSAPIALISVVTWMKNPYGDSAEVKVSRMNKRQTLIMMALGIVVTVAFYFILQRKKVGLNLKAQFG
jgi:nicotinamide mononucleotide transporter PnuC